MIIIFNWIGAGIFLVAVLASASAGALLGHAAQGLVGEAFVAFVIALDLLYGSR